jgi:hypothetical protein
MSPPANGASDKRGFKGKTKMYRAVQKNIDLRQRAGYIESIYPALGFKNIRKDLFKQALPLPLL